MDILNLQTTNGGEVMEIRHPSTGKVLKDEAGEEFHITLLGSDSDEYRGEIKRKLNEINRKNKRKAKGHADESDDLDFDKSEEQTAELFSKCTVGGYMIFDKKSFDFNDKKAVKELYLNPRLRWLREQVERFINDRSNFIKG